jgi:DNA-binding NarL/FixJ family response regulator
MQQSVAASTASGPRSAGLHPLAVLRVAGCAAAGAVRVAVAHQSPVARTALRAALDSAPGIAVVAEAASGEQALAAVAEVRPDVVVMDVALPGVGCVVATRRTRAASHAAVMLLSGDEPDPRVLAALQAGAGGVMRTDSAPSDLIRALTLLGRGRPLRPPRRRRARHPREETMQVPKVIEIRRGSAHRPTAIAPMAGAVASAARHEGGPRWNSGT